MSTDTTENDAEIARILAEEERHRSSLFSSQRSKAWKTDGQEQRSIKPSSSQADQNGQMALILQIEEIVLSENRVNHTMTKVSDGQLEKTHADMTKALQPTEQSDLLTRILGMFATIQTRYTTCQGKNQVLIDQMGKLAIQLYPLLISFQTKGKFGISKASVPAAALGLITNVLQGNLETADAKQIMINMFQIWNESSVWYEFLEQLVYILVAVTVPSFAQAAMGRLMARVSSPN